MQTFDSVFRQAIEKEVDKAIERCRDALETYPLPLDNVRFYQGKLAMLREIGPIMDEAAKVIEQRNT